MDDIGACAHVVVVAGDRVLLRRRMDGGRPVLEAPGVELRSGETPGLAARRAAREHLGLEVDLGDLVFADTEHGREHYFFLAEPTVGTDASPAVDMEVLSIRLAAVLGYIVEPRGLAVGLARLQRPRDRASGASSTVDVK